MFNYRIGFSLSASKFASRTDVGSVQLRLSAAQHNSCAVEVRPTSSHRSLSRNPTGFLSRLRLYCQLWWRKGAADHCLIASTSGCRVTLHINAALCYHRPLIVSGIDLTTAE